MRIRAVIKLMMILAPFLLAQETQMTGLQWIEYVVITILAAVFAGFGFFVRSAILRSQSNTEKIKPLENKIATVESNHNTLKKDHEDLHKKVTHIDKTVSRTNLVVNMIAKKMDIPIPDLSS